MAQGYHWSHEQIAALTETQLSMYCHAAWVSSERDEEKRRRDKICWQCANETVGYDGICAACGATNGDVEEPASIDKIIWGDEVYIGDQLMSAQKKFQMENPAGFGQWLGSFLPKD